MGNVFQNPKSKLCFQNQSRNPISKSKSKITFINQKFEIKNSKSNSKSKNKNYKFVSLG